MEKWVGWCHRWEGSGGWDMTDAAATAKDMQHFYVP